MSETPKRPDPALPPATPRWVKIFVIIFIVLAIVVVILHLMGFGFGHHGASSSGSYLLITEYAMKRL